MWRKTPEQSYICRNWLGVQSGEETGWSVRFRRLITLSWASSCPRKRHSLPNSVLTMRPSYNLFSRPLASTNPNTGSTIESIVKLQKSLSHLSVPTLPDVPTNCLNFLDLWLCFVKLELINTNDYSLFTSLFMLCFLPNALLSTLKRKYSRQWNGWIRNYKTRKWKVL